MGVVQADITTFWILARMSWVATKLYNTAMWQSRKQWEETGKIPTGFDMHKVVQASPFHGFVPTHTSQQCADTVGKAYRSWFKLRKEDPTAQPPGFRKKNALSSFVLTSFAFRAESKERFRLTLGSKLKDELNYPNRFLALNVKWNTTFPQNGKINQLEIVPKTGYFECHAKIELPEPEWKPEGSILAIDLGVCNPATTALDGGGNEIFNGGAILSTLRYWDKEKGRVQGEVRHRSKNKKEWSKPLSRMSKKNASQIEQAIHALSKTLAEDCEAKGVKEVVVGDLKCIKKEKDGKGKAMKKPQKQKVQQFPIRKLVGLLRYKLERRGIRLVEIDERGTSKGRCSVCGNTKRGTIHRVHRGMFKCDACGNTTNADVNGARNILDKYIHQLGKPSEGISGATLAAPLVRRWDGHRWEAVSVAAA